MYPITHYHLQATWIPFKNVVLLCTSLVMRKLLGCNMQRYFSTQRWGSNNFYLLFIQYTGCIMRKDHFFIKRTMQIMCLFWSKYMMNTDHKCVRCLVMMFLFFFMKGVVTTAHFQLMHAWLRTYAMRHVSDIIFPRRILYKESNYCAFVFILASLPHCLFPATAVAQDLLMSLS